MRPFFFGTNYLNLIYENFYQGQTELQAAKS